MGAPACGPQKFHSSQAARFQILAIPFDPRSSAAIRGKDLLLVFPISVISVDQWLGFAFAFSG